MLKYTGNKINTKIINNFIKYYIHYQKYRKLSSFFKFILIENINFNNFILDGIKYILLV